MGVEPLKIALTKKRGSYFAFWTVTDHGPKGCGCRFHLAEPEFEQHPIGQELNAFPCRQFLFFRRANGFSRFIKKKTA